MNYSNIDDPIWVKVRRDRGRGGIVLLLYVSPTLLVYTISYLLAIVYSSVGWGDKVTPSLDPTGFSAAAPWPMKGLNVRNEFFKNKNKW